MVCKKGCPEMATKIKPSTSYKNKNTNKLEQFSCIISAFIPFLDIKLFICFLLSCLFKFEKIFILISMYNKLKQTNHCIKIHQKYNIFFLFISVEGPSPKTYNNTRLFMEPSAELWCFVEIKLLNLNNWIHEFSSNSNI